MHVRQRLPGGVSKAGKYSGSILSNQEGEKMRKIILICDRCKKEVDKLNEVAAGIKRDNYSSYGGRSVSINSPITRNGVKNVVELLDSIITIRRHLQNTNRLLSKK